MGRSSSDETAPPSPSPTAPATSFSTTRSDGSAVDSPFSSSDPESSPKIRFFSASSSSSSSSESDSIRDFLSAGTSSSSSDDSRPVLVWGRSSSSDAIVSFGPFSSSESKVQGQHDSGSKEVKSYRNRMLERQLSLAEVGRLHHLSQSRNSQRERV